jgi:NADH:ubiquinone oxidoreductase subunit 6 (subunit J)
MVIGRKWLIVHLVVVVALFVISQPFGDNHHGLGKHNAFFATLGQGLFLTSLLAFVLLFAAVVVAVVQAIVRARRPGHAGQSV